MTMANYAIIRNGVVENLVVYDGETRFTPEGCEVVEATDNARIGSTYDGSFHFVEPTPPEPTAEQVAAAEARQSARDKLKALGLSDDEVDALT